MSTTLATNSIDDYGDLSQPSGGPNFRKYLHGLRRNWLLALVLGSVLGLLLACAVYFGWGWRYRAVATVRIATTDTRIVETMTPSDRFTTDAFEIFKGTQGFIVTSEPVLTRVLNRTNVYQLPLIQKQEDQLKWLAGAIRVTFPKNTELMQVSLQGANPGELKEIVNAVTEEYYDLVVGDVQTRRARRLEQLLDAQNATRQEIQEKMREVRRAARLLGSEDPESIEIMQRMHMQEFADLQRQLAQGKLLLSRATSEHQIQTELLDAIETVEISQIEIETLCRNDPMLAQVAKELAFRKMYQEDAVAMLGPNAPEHARMRYEQEAAAVQQQWDMLTRDKRDQVREMKRLEIEQERKRHEIDKRIQQNEVDVLTTAVDKKREQIESLGASSVEIVMDQSKIEKLDKVLESISQELEVLQVEMAAPPRIQYNETMAAMEPQTPSNGAALIALSALAGLIGMCLPGALLVVKDMLSQYVSEADDVSKEAGLEVAGSVPQIPARFLRPTEAPSADALKWQTRLGDAVNGVVAQCLHDAEKEDSRVILVSSAAGGEGKTTLATQLALGLARNGRKTVFVDFDLRRPACHQAFGLDLEPGVSETLRNETEASDVVREVSADLSVVTAGRLNQESLVELANGAGAAMLDQLRDEFEFIVIDSSPILPVADTRYVSQSVDRVLLSVFRDVSQIPKVRASRDVLHSFGVENVEAVVTCPVENFGIAPPPQ